MSATLLESFGKKLVRGITYLSENKLIYNDYNIQSAFPA
jgi:hypothetical protein